MRSNLHQHKDCSIVNEGRHEGNLVVVENLRRSQNLVEMDSFHLVLTPWLLSSIGRETDVERSGKRTETAITFMTISKLQKTLCQGWLNYQRGH